MAMPGLCLSALCLSGTEPVTVLSLLQKINKSSDKIQVRDLQLVTREAIGHMKEDTVSRKVIFKEASAFGGQAKRE